VERGVRSLTDDVKLWEKSQKHGSIKTITKQRIIEPWFSKDHIHDAGASSQKLGLLSYQNNIMMFGNDSFDK
jgi:hypothetical protein